jgi:LPS export ABC transporter protein LptC
VKKGKGKKVKKSRVSPAMDEPLLNPLVAEPTGVRWRRIFWLLGALILAGAALDWGLSRSKPQPTSSETLFQEGNSPDAVIQKFHLISTVQGQKRWTLDADTARYYQGQKQAYADVIYAQYYKKDKIVSTLTSDKAIINTETNATRAEGHVELIVENGSKLETDHLNWDPVSDTISTDARVHVYKGSDDITAVGLKADTQLNNIQFKKDVHTQVRDTREIENFQKSKKF